MTQISVDNFLNRYTAIGGAIVVSLTIWGTMGFPRPATSMDIERLEQSQLDTAIKFYEFDVDRHIILRGQLRDRGVSEFNPEFRAIERQIERSRENLDRARHRKLELERR